MNLSLSLPTTTYTLRPYQQEAVEAGLSYFRGKSCKGALMMLPTGSGKSLVIAGIARELDEPTLVFQPRKEILEQNLEKLRAYGEEPTIYSASMNRKQLSNLTLATIGSVVRTPELFKEFKNIIIDEAHYVNPKQGMYRDFLELVGDKVLGVTATPYRLTTDNYGGSILKFLTRTRPKIFHDLIYYVQNGKLFDDGFLSPLVYKQVEGFDTGKLTLNSTGADFTDQSVQNYYKEYGFVDKLAQTVQKCLDAGRKNILVFTRFVDEAGALADRFPGIADIVTAEHSKRERAKVIGGFRNGKIKVVANVGILSIGFDYPELETVIIGRPTMSLALYYQMIGRAIRPHPDKESAWVIDMCDNFPKFGKVEDLILSSHTYSRWFIKSNGRALTNIYFGDIPNFYKGRRW